MIVLCGLVFATVQGCGGGKLNGKYVAEASETLWGEPPESVQQWLLGHEAEICESLAAEMIRVCRRERARAMRRAGARDTILGGLLAAGGGAGFLICVLRIDAGGGTLEFAGAVACAAPAVTGVLLLLRGLERMLFGAQADGEANDTVLWD